LCLVGREKEMIGTLVSYSVSYSDSLLMLMMMLMLMLMFFVCCDSNSS
jgi:hypothetical protein